jgi:hypothetical protein
MDLTYFYAGLDQRLVGVEGLSRFIRSWLDQAKRTKAKQYLNQPENRHCASLAVSVLMKPM